MGLERIRGLVDAVDVGPVIDGRGDRLLLALVNAFPSAVESTTVALPFAASGSDLCRSSITAWNSVPGMDSLLENGSRRAIAEPPTRPSSSTQVSTTAQA